MKGLHVCMKYKEMFGKYEGTGQKIFANVCLYVTQLRSGEDPELRNTLKNAS